MTIGRSNLTYQLFVGIDIAATSFTATWTTGGPVRERVRTFDQTPEGYCAFQRLLATTDVAPGASLLVREATGRYWVTLAVTVHEAGDAVRVRNPTHVHAFARSLPRRATTDALDAQRFAQFAAERQPVRWTPPPQVYHELRQRLVVRDGLLSMRQQARNQRHALRQWPVTISGAQEALDAILDALTTQIQTLDKEITSVLREGVWAESATLLTRSTGIRVMTSAWLLVGTLNFTACTSAESAAASVGLVPLIRESGSRVRGRAQIGPGGHARLRKARYMATMSAARLNPMIRVQYERRRAAGKPAKVARCAAARKRLHVAYAVVTTRRPFDPSSSRADAMTVNGVSRAA